MANTKPQPAPVADDANKSPAFGFEPFSWTPNNLPSTVTVSSHLLCKLVNNAQDICDGAALVFELTTGNDIEICADEKPYLSSFHIGILQKMANAGLYLLSDIAQEMASELHSMDKVEI